MEKKKFRKIRAQLLFYFLPITLLPVIIIVALINAPDFKSDIEEFKYQIDFSVKVSESKKAYIWKNFIQNVPGVFLSMLGNALLNKIIIEEDTDESSLILEI